MEAAPASGVPPQAQPKDAHAAAFTAQVEGYKNAEGLLNTCLALDCSADDLQGKFGMRAANYWCFDEWDTDRTYARLREAPEATGTPRRRSNRRLP